MPLPRDDFWLSRDEVRDLDRRASAEFGMPSVVLMENAGRGVAVLMRRLNPEKKPVTILCGPGNNGGDGFVIARHLEIYGWPVRVWLFAPSKESTSSILRLGISPKLSPDCDINFRIFVRQQTDISFVDTQNRFVLMDQLTQDVHFNEGWIIDALFGTGLDRPLESPYVEIVSALNASDNPVLAVDIPSGLDCDTGEPLGPTVHADHTATFVANKKGFLQPAAQPWIGQVHVVDIGAPKKLIDQYRALERLEEENTKEG
ncbi:MAG: NAD(P)H-hydrate epimerase [Planctomycetes bacterium]|nr:NAD(P)H-hydrate epimerase [Planctomycetota bacterium]